MLSFACFDGPVSGFKSPGNGRDQPLNQDMVSTIAQVKLSVVEHQWIQQICAQKDRAADEASVHEEKPIGAIGWRVRSPGDAGFIEVRFPGVHRAFLACS